MMQRCNLSIVNHSLATSLGAIAVRLSHSVAKLTTVIAQVALIALVFFVTVPLTVAYFFWLFYLLWTSWSADGSLWAPLGEIACTITFFLRPIIKAAQGNTADSAQLFRDPVSNAMCKTPTTLGTRWWIIPFSIVGAPGIFAGLTLAAWSAVPSLHAAQTWSVSVPYNWEDPFIVGVWTIVPFLASWKLWLCLSRQYLTVGIGPDGLVTKGGKSSQSIPWSKVSTVIVDKLDHVKGSHYHADDLQQQKLVLTCGSEDSISIALHTLNPNERKRLALELKKHLPTRVFTESGLNFIKQVCPEPEKKRVDGDKGSCATASLTDIWQQDLKQHIGRTNYVPLEIDAQLQGGRIHITGYLSSGGFSTTYMAQRMSNLENKREVVVIKESSLPQGLSDVARLKISDMFAREARLLQKCNHPRIAKVLDFFHENGREYLALEYLEGVRLSDVISKESKSSELQCIKWALELSQLLDYLHTIEPAIIHRDFTPENLILHTSGHLHLIDFGAANEFLGGATGTLIGKQAYIAPEQFQGKATTQSDIYALGATLFFILTAQEPLPLSPSHPRLVRPEISEDLDQFIASCTDLDPLKRIGSASELIGTLTTLRTRLAAAGTE
jgi:hypothetical protein